MPFGVNPETGGAQEAPEAFGTYIQFQQNGANLGAATVHTVNLTSGITASRGTGENAGVLTLSAAGGGGSAEPSLVLLLESLANTTFAGADFSNWDGTERVASADAEWNSGAQEVVFNRTGVYEVRVLGEVVAVDGSWPAGGQEAIYGAYVPSAVDIDRTAYSRGPASLPGLANNPGFMRWTDSFLFNVSDIEEDSFPVCLYARGYSDTQACSMRAQVTVRRIADPFEDGA